MKKILTFIFLCASAYTADFVTWDNSRTFSGNVTYSNSDRDAAYIGSAVQPLKVTNSITTGKHYLEVYKSSGFSPAIGICRSDYNFDGNYPGQSSHSVGYLSWQSDIYFGGDASPLDLSVGWGTGSTCSMLVDLDIGKIRFYMDGSPICALLDIPGWTAGDAYYVSCAIDAAYSISANFGQSTFTYATIPTDYGSQLGFGGAGTTGGTGGTGGTTTGATAAEIYAAFAPDIDLIKKMLAGILFCLAVLWGHFTFRHMYQSYEKDGIS